MAIPLPPETFTAFPPHGPISDLRIVIFVELEMTTQSPEGFVMCRFSTIVPFCPLSLIGPDGVREEVVVAGGITCTVALADWVGAATLVAVTVAEDLVDTTGAVNNPAEIVPALTVQVTV
jgi:hypothetical protein